MPDPEAITGLDAGHLDDARFAALMAPLGPFEARPWLAVAISGGPDSLALGLLADRWARRQGGAVVGLIVDHGLRPESTGEARQTGGWLTAREIAWQLLTWSGAKPTAGIQAAARTARYRLLGDWCRAAGVLHLLTAHHLDDQAETVALRQARASGPDGLAGMAAVRELAGLRLLRPLLTVPKTALLAYLRALDQPWLDDPSNRSPAVRPHAGCAARPGSMWLSLRALRPGTAPPGQRGSARLAPGWRGMCGSFRAGFVLVAQAELAAAPVEIARRAVQQMLCAVGGRPWPPRQARLARLLDALRIEPRLTGRTLGGCRLLRQGDRLLVCREAGAITEVLEPRPGVWHSWDRPLCGPSDRRGRGPLGAGARRRGLAAARRVGARGRRRPLCRPWSGPVCLRSGVATGFWPCPGSA